MTALAAIPRRLRLPLGVLLLLLADVGVVVVGGQTPYEQWGAWRVHFNAWAHRAGLGLSVLELAALLGLLGWALPRRPWLAGARWLVAAVLMSGFWTQALKHLVGRPRPRVFLAEHAWLPVGPTFRSHWDSFPSGHAMTVFAAVPLLAALFPKLRHVWLTLAVLVAAGRVVGCDHYVSDVVVGAWLGLTLGHYVRERWRAELATPEATDG